MRISELFEDDEQQKYADLIKSECSVALEGYKSSGKFLFRGVRGKNSRFINETIRKDRSTVQMPLASHYLLHEMYTELGLKATRKNSIFCSANPDTADDWADENGKTYVVFPKNGWSGLVFMNYVDDYSYYSVSKTAAQALSWYKRLVPLDEQLDINNPDNAPKIADQMRSLDASAWREALYRISNIRPRQLSTSAHLAWVVDAGYIDVLITGDSYYGVRADGAKAFLRKYLGVEVE